MGRQRDTSAQSLSKFRLKVLGNSSMVLPHPRADSQTMFVKPEAEQWFSSYLVINWVGLSPIRKIQDFKQLEFILEILCHWVGHFSIGGRTWQLGTSVACNCATTVQDISGVCHSGWKFGEAFGQKGCQNSGFDQGACTWWHCALDSKLPNTVKCVQSTTWQRRACQKHRCIKWIHGCKVHACRIFSNPQAWGATNAPWARGRSRKR